MHPRAKNPGVPLGDARDEVRVSGHGHSRRKSTDDDGNVPLQTKKAQSLIYRLHFETPTRDSDVSAVCISAGRDLSLTQGVTQLHDAYKTISKQSLGANLRPHRRPDNTCLQIDSSLAKLCTVFIQFLHEAKAHIWSLGADAGNKV